MSKEPHVGTVHLADPVALCSTRCLSHRRDWAPARNIRQEGKLVLRWVEEHLLDPEAREPCLYTLQMRRKVVPENVLLRHLKQKLEPLGLSCLKL